MIIRIILEIQFLGKYCLSKPLAFSFTPLSHEPYGRADNMFVGKT
jgi:hypothetical protein